MRVIEMNLPNAVVVDATAGPDVPALYDRLMRASVTVATPNKVALSGAQADYDRLQALARAPRRRSALRDQRRRRPAHHRHARRAASRRATACGASRACSRARCRTSSPRSRAAGASARSSGRRRRWATPSPTRATTSRAWTCGASCSSSPATPASGSSPTPPPSAPSCPPPVRTRRRSTRSTTRSKPPTATSTRSARPSRSAATSCAPWRRSTCAPRTASVAVVPVGPEHPAFGLEPGDNLVAFTTDRYAERPLVVRGPGAGAEVTAAGVFAELVQIGGAIRVGVEGYQGGRVKFNAHDPVRGLFPFHLPTLDPFHLPDCFRARDRLQRRLRLRRAGLRHRRPGRRRDGHRHRGAGRARLVCHRRRGHGRGPAAARRRAEHGRRCDCAPRGRRRRLGGVFGRHRGAHREADAVRERAGQQRRERRRRSRRGQRAPRVLRSPPRR